MKTELVIITPVFEDRESFNELISDLSTECNHSIHVIAVDDGSLNEPIDEKCFIGASFTGTIVRLIRNLGHQQAIAVGLCYSSDNINAEYVAIMDSDGEDRPNSLNELIEILVNNNDIDIVVAERRNRIESRKFKLFYKIYKTLFKLLTGYKVSFGNFMVIKNTHVKRLISMPEIWVHIPASVLISKLRIERRPIDRGQRYAGNSKMNLISLSLHGLRSLMVYSESLFIRIGILLSILILLSVIGFSTALFLKLIGIASPGWLTSVAGILAVILIQTVTLTLLVLMISGGIRSNPIKNFNYKELIISTQEIK